MTFVPQIMESQWDKSNYVRYKYSSDKGHGKKSRMVAVHHMTNLVFVWRRLANLIALAFIENKYCYLTICVISKVRNPGGGLNKLLI